MNQPEPVRASRISRTSADQRRPTKPIKADQGAELASLRHSIRAGVAGIAAGEDTRAPVRGQPVRELAEVALSAVEQKPRTRGQAVSARNAHRSTQLPFANGQADT